MRNDTGKRDKRFHGSRLMSACCSVFRIIIMPIYNRVCISAPYFDIQDLFNIH